MCVEIFTNANGPMLIHKYSDKCGTSLRSILECRKGDLSKILADCQYHSHELEFTPEEIQKIQSAAKHDYRCADEMLKKNSI